MTATGSLPANARWPVSISYRTAPRDQTSDRSSTDSPLTCSGDMYAIVPSVRPVRVTPVCPRSLRDSEIEDLDDAIRRDHDIRGFDVPVDDARLMGLREPLGHLNRDVQRFLDREGCAFEPCLQSLALASHDADARRRFGAYKSVGLLTAGGMSAAMPKASRFVRVPALRVHSGTTGNYGHP